MRISFILYYSSVKWIFDYYLIKKCVLGLLFLTIFTDKFYFR